MNHHELTIDDLKPAAYNPRMISEDAALGLRASIETFGDISGIVWNARSGNLVAGHQRVDQLRALGAQLLDRGGAKVLVAKVRGELVEFPVRVVDWDEATEKAANVAANNAAIAGEFTDDLAPLLNEIRGSIGDEQFESLRLDILLNEAQPDEAPETQEDDVPDAPIDPVTKPGDLWILGDHRLLCGDSTKPDDVARLMDGKRAVLMNTDPPYGVDYAAVKNGIPRSGFRDIQARGGDIANDDLTSGPALQDFLERMIKAFVPHLIENPAFYFWHPMLTQSTFFAAAAAAADILIHRQIVWVKPHMVLTRSGMYHWRHELCFYGWIRGKPCVWYGDKSQTSVWELGESQHGRVHPTQKPVALFAPPMHNHTKKGDVVCEPFSGSGSQFIAAEQLERRCFGMELEPKYCDVIVERWETLTGGQARRVSNA